METEADRDRQAGRDRQADRQKQKKSKKKQGEEKRERKRRRHQPRRIKKMKDRDGSSTLCIVKIERFQTIGKFSNKLKQQNYYEANLASIV